MKYLDTFYGLLCAFAIALFSVAVIMLIVTDPKPKPEPCPSQHETMFELRLEHTNAFGRSYRVRHNGTNVGHIRIPDELPFGSEYTIIVIKPD
jgi:hypothetical protein